MRKFSFLFLSFIAIFLLAKLTEAAETIIDIGFIDFEISKTSSGEKKAEIVGGTTLGAMITPDPSWEATEVVPGVLHIKIPNPDGAFLKVDLGRKQVFLMTGGLFGREGGSEALLQNASILFSNLGQQLAVVRLNNVKLAIDTENDSMKFVYEKFRLTGSEAMEISKPTEGFYYFRFRAEHIIFPKLLESAKKMQQQFPDRVVAIPQERYWEVDVRSKKLTQIQAAFGERGSRMPIIPNFTPTPAPNPVPTRVPSEPLLNTKVHPDLAMEAAQKAGFTESSWALSERELFREALSKQKFDILVIPFQVQDYAFDQIERSVMTQCLVQRLKASANLKIPDPEMVDRALGNNYRTFQMSRIYELANALGVKTLIRGYAGHNLDMKMHLTIAVQEKPETSGFTAAARVNEIQFENLAFSDEILPSEIFFKILPDILSAIGVKENKSVTSADSGIFENFVLPANFIDLASNEEKPPMLRAAYLSIFGALSPSGSPEFFIRSLALLADRPRSADADFLKAYALANLFRRPAAIEILQKPSTPEQRALRTYLDGDLAKTSELINEIRSSIPKLLIQIALNDLRRSYDYQSAQIAGIKEVMGVPAGWKPFLSQRFADQDVWETPNTLVLKAFLDEASPVKGYAIQDILRGMAVRGELEASDIVKIDTSIHEHRKKLLKEQPSIAAEHSGDRISSMDILDFAAVWALRAAYKNIYIPIGAQGLYQEGINLASKYETYYKDLSEIRMLKVKGLRKLSSETQGDESRNLYREASALIPNACLWVQGQSRLTPNTDCDLKMYDNDFPRRPFWPTNYASLSTNTTGDRDGSQFREIALNKIPMFEAAAKLERAILRDYNLSLLYTIDNFDILENYYKKLLSLKLPMEADSLLERNKGRFNGHPYRVLFLTKQYEKQNDDKSIIKLHEDAIRIIPRQWDMYYSLGNFYLTRGDIQKANATFRQFPLFQNNGKEAESENVETVSLSNCAYNAGLALLHVGAMEEAKYFFKLSAGYETGSASEMRSEYLLALNGKNYADAAETILGLARRYSSNLAYADFLQLLSVTGNGSEAERLFLNLGMMDKSEIEWDGIIPVLRQAGKNNEEIRTWLDENGKGKVQWFQSQEYYLKSLLVDRTPESSLVDMLENLKPNNQGSAQYKTKDGKGRELGSTAAIFAAARYEAMLKQYEYVFNLLNPLFENSEFIKDSGAAPLLPYYVWSATKSGKAEAAEKAIGAYKLRGRNFEFWLATAMMKAAAKDHKAAQEALELARANANSSFSNARPVPVWYQLVESCELLHEDTKFDVYRSMALDFARIHQQMYPLDSWAYAVEAKYVSEKDRLRPLAIALYLDKRSCHVSGIPEQEKKNAQKWLESNNPFLRETKKSKGNQI